MCLYIRILVNIFRSARASNTVHAALCPRFAKYVDFFTRYFGEFRVLRDFPVNCANFQTCPHKKRAQGKPITYSIRTENENGQTFYYTCTQYAVFFGADADVRAKSYSTCGRPFFVQHSRGVRPKETFSLVSSKTDNFWSEESSITGIYYAHLRFYLTYGPR